jgi:hypothetical protein
VGECRWAEPPVEAAGGFLAIEIEEQIGGGGQERGVAVQDGLVDEIFGDHRFIEALGADQHHILRRAEEVEAEDALDEPIVARARSLATCCTRSSSRSR